MNKKNEHMKHKNKTKKKKMEDKNDKMDNFGKKIETNRNTSWEEGKRTIKQGIQESKECKVSNTDRLQSVLA